MKSNLKQQWFSCPKIKGVTPLRSHTNSYSMSVAGLGAEDKKFEVGT